MKKCSEGQVERMPVRRMRNVTACLAVPRKYFDNLYSPLIYYLFVYYYLVIYVRYWHVDLNTTYCSVSRQI